MDSNEYKAEARNCRKSIREAKRHKETFMASRVEDKVRSF